jgi:hypothetical protein
VAPVQPRPPRDPLSGSLVSGGALGSGIAVLARAVFPQAWREIVECFAPAAATLITAVTYFMAVRLRKLFWEKDRVRMIEACTARLGAIASLTTALNAQARVALENERGCWELRLVAAHSAHFPVRSWEDDCAALEDLAARLQKSQSR